MTSISSILSTEVILWIGVALVVLAVVQALIGLFSTLKRSRLATEQQQLSIKSLHQEIENKTLFKALETNKLTNIWAGFRKFRIETKTMEGGGICSFYLVPHDGKSLPKFEPGQYLTFNLKVPDSDKPVVRCYSLSDSPQKADSHYRVSIKHALPPPKAPDAPPGQSSSFFHETLREGDIVDTRAPGGNFYMDQTQHTPVVLIGGGVGITPVLSMLNSIVDSNSQREAWFFYGVRHGEEHVMREHLANIDKNHENAHIKVCYSDPREGIDQEGEDYAFAERVSVELFKRVLPSNNFDFYICGPPPMMDSLVKDLGDWGVPEKHIHFEAFGPASVKKKPAPVDAAAAGSGTTFSVNFSKSGKTGEWSPDKGSLLDFAEEQGVAIDFGCRAGSCGTCTTAIRSGEVDYADPPSAPLESGSCLPCIGTPKSAIVIDA